MYKKYTNTSSVQHTRAHVHAQLHNPRMVYLDYITCLRYTILVWNPQCVHTHTRTCACINSRASTCIHIETDRDQRFLSQILGVQASCRLSRFQNTDTGPTSPSSCPTMPCSRAATEVSLFKSLNVTTSMVGLKKWSHNYAKTNKHPKW